MLSGARLGAPAGAGFGVRVGVVFDEVFDVLVEAGLSALDLAPWRTGRRGARCPGRRYRVLVDTGLGSLVGAGLGTPVGTGLDVRVNAGFGLLVGAGRGGRARWCGHDVLRSLVQGSAHRPARGSA